MLQNLGRQVKRACVVAAVVAQLSANAGCSSDLGSIAQGALPYQHSNAMMPAGFSEDLIGPDRYRIEVKGPLNTPRDRLEKMAATRAAEIGRDNHLKFFRIDSVQHTTHCKSYTTGGKPGSMGSGDKKRSMLAILTADVTYAQAPLDANFRESKPAFDQYRADLDQTAAPPPPLDPALAAQCG